MSVESMLVARDRSMRVGCCHGPAFSVFSVATNQSGSADLA